MKIRTQLILAFLLLAVLPLAGIVLYSYYSSLRAVKRAAAAEAGALTREMDGRMAAIKGELVRGVERMGDVPLEVVVRAAREGKADPMLGRMVMGFGKAAPLIGALEFVPDPPKPKPAPAGEKPQIPVPPAAPEPPSAPVPELPEVLDSDHPMVIDVAGVMRDVQREVQKEIGAAPGADPRAAAAIAKALESHRERIEALKRQTVASRLALGRDFEVPVVERGEVVGKLKAQVKSDAVLRRVLARTGGGEGEIAFAVDGEGGLHTVNDEDRRRIENLPPLLRAVHQSSNSARWVLDDWVVASSKDPDTGLVFGIARPVPLEEVKQTAARNFGYGLGLTALALFGILPLSGRMTRNLHLVTAGADRIAHGDLDTRVPVRSKDEFGKLALAFNRMAADLKEHQERLLEEERLRKAGEIEQAVLQKDYERKSRELEEARRFQLSLLPRTLPEHPGFEIAVSMRTATEVGGDYYDFVLADEGALTAAVGDATGHGARAGTMVTAVKSLFSADAGASAPRQFLVEAARAVKRMALDRMAMGLCLARLSGNELVVSSAGMPPLLVYRRASGKVEEVALAGMPLGGLAFDYEERRLEVEPGDVLLLMTDGLPELADPEGEPLGYPRVRSLFAELGGHAPTDVIAGLTSAADAWAAGQPPRDDVTLVAIRVR